MSAIKLFALLFAVAAAGSGLLHAGENASGKLEVSFDYQRQPGFASNQFAVWIENANGNMAKTLFVTDFTARHSGWKTREQSIPQWVRTSKVASMPAEQVDAVSGATPASGKMTLEWDGRDESGATVPPGTYMVVLEASLRGHDRVVYTAPVEVGGAMQEDDPEPQYNGSDTAERGMIANVKFRYIPY